MFIYEVVSRTTLGWVGSGVVCNAAFRALRTTCGPFLVANHQRSQVILSDPGCHSHVSEARVGPALHGKDLVRRRVGVRLTLDGRGL